MFGVDIMTNQDERKWRIEESAKLFTKEISEAQALFKIMNKWGISKRIAKEYLEMLVELKLVKLEKLKGGKDGK